MTKATKKDWHPADTIVFGRDGNTLPELFAEGFRFGLERWRAGETAESISNKGAEVRKRCEAAGAGMEAASSALLGWRDCAERDALAWNLSRDAASRLVAESNERRNHGHAPDPGPGNGDGFDRDF